MAKKRLKLVVSILAVALLTTIAAPQVLAFPYRRSFGSTDVRSEIAIPNNMASILAHADGLMHASAIYTPTLTTRIFLTDGGWRWHLLTLGAWHSFALSRPVVETIVVNKSDPKHDRVSNGSGFRTLSGTIAHERTHGLMRARYGIFSDWWIPTWKREGYADYVAHESSLSKAGAEAVERTGRTTPALLYYRARQKVAEVLAKPSSSVDSLMNSGS